jgi:hypothetical protein
MARVIYSASYLLSLIKIYRPTVERHQKECAEAYEEWARGKERALAKASTMPTPQEVDMMVADEIAAKSSAWKRIFRAEYTHAKALEAVVAKNRLSREKNRAMISVKYDMLRPDQDHIGPVFNYLTKLCEGIDPETLIALSDNETFQLNRAAELHREYTGNEAGISDGSSTPSG